MISKNYATPQDAEQAFYRAFEHADLIEMMAVWAEEDDIHHASPLAPQAAPRETPPSVLH